MDWSDEKVSTYTAWWCGISASCFECDEHICGHRTHWSCGNGECMRWSQRLPFHELVPRDANCYNLRNLYFMCELSTIPVAKLWTQTNGMCTHNLSYAEGHLNLTATLNQSNESICIYLIRCSLSMNLNCPCNESTCAPLMDKFCEKGMSYAYPTGPLIRPYLWTYFDWENLSPVPQFIVINGSIRCRGYRASAFDEEITLELNMVLFNRLDYLLCQSEHRDSLSALQYDAACWNTSFTFDGQPYGFYDICDETRECISQYRILNQFNDCPFADDEFALIERDLCSNIREQRFRCSEDQYSCLTVQTLGDENNHCRNNFDENLYGSGPFLGGIVCQSGNTDNCALLKDYMMKKSNVTRFNTTFYARLRFRAYCDGEWNLGDHSDESPTFCSLWTCRQEQYQCRTGQCIDLSWVCDGTWDCRDGSDEEALSMNQPWLDHNQQLDQHLLSERLDECDQRYKIQPFAQLCDLTHEYPCFLKNASNPLDVVTNRPCIPFSWIGDDKVDCYGALDEKNTLTDDENRMRGYGLQCPKGNFVKYPLACMDDECFDPILCSYKSRNVSYCFEVHDALCLNGFCAHNGRCNGSAECPFGEDEHWCHPKGYPSLLSFYRNTKKWLPSQKQSVRWPTFPSPISNSGSFSRQSVSRTDAFHAMSFQCNRGVAVFEREQISCLCPPAYYGRWCEYYSDRLSVIVQIDWTTFALFNMTGQQFTIETLFLFDGERIIDRYELRLDPALGTKKYKFYLLYSRATDMLQHKRNRFSNRTAVGHLHPYSVRFELYSHEHDHSIAELGSWQYPIFFDFLPAYRLAVVLKLPRWFGNRTLDPCFSRNNAKCPRHAQCKPIFNSNGSSYCSCDYGFYGARCEQYLSSCHSYCSSESTCKPHHNGTDTVPYCICPSSYFGPSCHLRHVECDGLPCGTRKTCRLTYDLTGERLYQCVCDRRNRTTRCDDGEASVQIKLNITDDLTQASVTQFYHVHEGALYLLLQRQNVHHGIPEVIRYDHEQALSPALAVLKTYQTHQTPANYYILYVQPNAPILNIVSTPVMCPHSSTLLSGEGVVFRYHNICRTDRFCFYDETYVCICESGHYRAECFGHDLALDQCDRCLSQGRCVRGDLDDENAFVCLCPYCHQGQLCEFSMEALGFTIDSLLAPDSTGIRLVYVSVTLLMMAAGCFTNFCSLITFKRSQVRKHAVGSFLLVASILNQCAMTCLFAKFVHVLLGSLAWTDMYSCKIVSYLLSVLTRSSAWMMSWISLNRLCLVLLPTSIRLKSPTLATYSSAATLLGLLLMHMHEMIVYTTIQAPNQHAIQCVTNFQQTTTAIYNRMSCIFHSLVPFSIQVISITLLIVMAARSRARTSGTDGKRRNFLRQLKTQMLNQKELYITPIFIVLSALPQTVLTFNLACIRLSHWKRHSLLAATLVSYSPQMFGFLLYVLPSTNYKKEFQLTSIGRRLF